MATIRWPGRARYWLPPDGAWFGKRERKTHVLEFVSASAGFSVLESQSDVVLNNSRFVMRRWCNLRAMAPPFASLKHVLVVVYLETGGTQT